MTLTGHMLIGGQGIAGSREAIRAINPATDTVLEPAYAGAAASMSTRPANSRGKRLIHIARRPSVLAPNFSKPSPMKSKPSVMR